MQNKSYNILAINPGHNGSAAFLVDGELVYYCEEERLSRMKYDGNPFRAMLQVLINNNVDELVIGGTTTELPVLPWTSEDPYTALVRKFNPGVKVTKMGDLHHLGHAAAAFFGSGFESAAAVIVDGAGSYHRETVGEGGQTVGGFETETIYQCSYPDQFNAMYKRYSDGACQYYDNGIQEFDNSVTTTKAYEAVSYYLGFGFIEAGKTMGLAPYGRYDSNIPPFFDAGKGNKNLLIPYYPAGAIIDENRYPYLKRFVEPSEWHVDPNLVRDVDKNLAWHVQNDTEQQMFALIQKAIDITGETNVVISGGYGLNCVANYRYLKQFPGINFYIDPVAHDGGTAIGLARWAWHKYSSSTTPNPTTTLYCGTSPDYGQLDIARQQIPSMLITDAGADTVADIIASGKIVALYQGRAEAGPRALGNRSLLFDPRRPDGKDIVNTVKRREWFRPFAATILEGDADSWFDMAGMTSSPHMMYAVESRPGTPDRVPAVCHVDGTCRVQTVNVDQNPAMFDLLQHFKQRTGVPLVLNTSLNLAGQPLVDSVFDAILMFYDSGVDHLWLPEIGKLLSKG